MGNRSATESAEHIGVASATISRVQNGRTAASMDLSIRLGETFSKSPDFLLEGAIAAGFVGSFAAEAQEDQAADRIDEGAKSSNPMSQRQDIGRSGD